MRAFPVLLATLLAISAQAASTQTRDTDRIGTQSGIVVTVNNRSVDFNDGKPMMQNGRVLVPLRDVLQSLPAVALAWDPRDQTVSAAYLDRTVRLRIGSKTANVTGHTLDLDVPATTIHGRTMVPLRFLSEALGAVVTWSEADQRVDISLPRSAVPAGSVATAVPQSRRFFRTAQSRSRQGVQLADQQQTMTDAELLAAIEQQLQLDYNQWAADRGAWMVDYANFLQWANLQSIFNTYTIVNGSSALTGGPGVSYTPMNPTGWAQWQTYLQMDYQRDIANQQRFNSDYAAYVEVFRRVNPKGTPIPRPAPP